MDTLAKSKERDVHKNEKTWGGDSCDTCISLVNPHTSIAKETFSFLAQSSCKTENTVNWNISVAVRKSTETPWVVVSESGDRPPHFFVKEKEKKDTNVFGKACQRGWKPRTSLLRNLYTYLWTLMLYSIDSCEKKKNKNHIEFSRSFYEKKRERYGMSMFLFSLLNKRWSLFFLFQTKRSQDTFLQESARNIEILNTQFQPLFIDRMCQKEQKKKEECSEA